MSKENMISEDETQNKKLPTANNQDFMTAFHNIITFALILKMFQQIMTYVITLGEYINSSLV
ncbi:MAG: hypothetical protein KGI10_01255 [Thaumarchaeota archaeon]|nr:hypothetical protein [Nitrososphaerota archaeon]